MGLAAFHPPYCIHLGCNITKLDGFVNVDARETSATDIVHNCTDLSPFPDNSATLIFSHAFFEHLYRDQRTVLLSDIRRVLRPDGGVFFCGIPDFEIIARCYLEGTAGNVSPIFNLHEVYRYTHGDPEQEPTWWLEQLHKSLFDQRELKSLLFDAGFSSPCIFRYAFRTEPNPTNLAFVATKDNARIAEDILKHLFNAFSFIYGTNAISVLSI